MVIVNEICIRSVDFAGYISVSKCTWIAVFSSCHLISVGMFLKNHSDIGQLQVRKPVHVA